MGGHEATDGAARAAQVRRTGRLWAYAYALGAVDASLQRLPRLAAGTWADAPYQAGYRTAAAACARQAPRREAAES